MKKYKINDDWSILAALPYSFQISSNTISHRLVDHMDDPNANNPHPITINESLSKHHILLSTPRKYMRIVWYEDPDEPNGQIDMGIRTPDASIDFASWLTLTNGVPHEVVAAAFYVITAPELMKEYEVPLFESKLNNTNNELQPLPLPPPPPQPSGKTKKRKYKIKSSSTKTQRRLANF